MTIQQEIITAQIAEFQRQAAEYDEEAARFSNTKDMTLDERRGALRYMEEAQESAETYRMMVRELKKLID